MILKNNSKNYYKIEKTNKIFKLIVIFLIIITISYIAKLIINNISNYFLKNSIAEVEQITSALINYSVTDDMLTTLELDNLYRITKNSDNEVEMIDYNPVAVNIFLNKVTNAVQDGLFKMEQGDLTIIGKDFNDDGTIFYIPFGSITANPLLNNIGPKIPVKIKTVGSILSNVDVKIKEYGINNCLIEMNLVIEIKQQIMLPLISKKIKIINDMPISYKIINGKIPDYYSGSLSKGSNIYSIPIE